MVIGFQWRLRSRQYNSKKCHKYHIKTFSLCDSITGYSLNILIYFGQETTFNLHIDENPYADSQAVKIFDKLLERYSGRHHLFADRFYTSISLIQYLESKHFNLTGTINMQRRFFPQELKRNNVNHRQANWFIDQDEKWLAVQWKDKVSTEPVSLVTTKGEAVEIPVSKRQARGAEQERQDREAVHDRQTPLTKPKSIDEYNHSINGCDRLDQMVLYYGCHNRKTAK